MLILKDCFRRHQNHSLLAPNLIKHEALSNFFEIAKLLFSALIGASFSGVEYVSLSSLLIMLPDCIGCCFLLFLLQLNFSFSIPGSNFKNRPLCYRFLHG